MSFTNATLVLSIGETVEEVKDSGFFVMAPRLPCSCWTTRCSGCPWRAAHSPGGGRRGGNPRESDRARRRRNARQVAIASRRRAGVLRARRRRQPRPGRLEDLGVSVVCLDLGGCRTSPPLQLPGRRRRGQLGACSASSRAITASSSSRRCSSPRAPRLAFASSRSAPPAAAGQRRGGAGGAAAAAAAATTTGLFLNVGLDNGVLQRLGDATTAPQRYAASLPRFEPVKALPRLGGRPRGATAARTTPTETAAVGRFWR